jgi:hypothetical protein
VIDFLAFLVNVSVGEMQNLPPNRARSVEEKLERQAASGYLTYSGPLASAV